MRDYLRYAQREFELKFSTLSKADDVKYTKNRNNITLSKKIYLHKDRFMLLYGIFGHIRILGNFNNELNGNSVNIYQINPYFRTMSNRVG